MASDIICVRDKSALKFPSPAQWWKTGGSEAEGAGWEAVHSSDASRGQDALESRGWR